MTRLRLLSNNQWKCDQNQPAWEKQGLDCSAAVREEGFARLYAEALPDVIGGQEISFAMGDELIRALSRRGLRYAMLFGRDTPILFRPDRLELVDSDFSLYPDEFPNHEGSFNNSKTKSWALAVFRVKESGKCFLFATTHLWWKSGNPASSHYQAFSDEARAYQLGLLMDQIDEYQAVYRCPAVFCGDLNADYRSLALRAAFERGYAHAHDIAVEYRDGSRGYHPCGPNGFGPMSEGDFNNAIDHILVRDAPAGFVRRFERYTPDYYMPLSDHSPVWVDVAF